VAVDETLKSEQWELRIERNGDHWNEVICYRSWGKLDKI